MDDGMNEAKNAAIDARIQSLIGGARGNTLAAMRPQPPAAQPVDAAGDDFSGSAEALAAQIQQEEAAAQAAGAQQQQGGGGMDVSKIASMFGG